MIDAIQLSPQIHVITGTIVLIALLAALVVTSVFALRDRTLSRGGHAALVVAQVALIVQALVGIKLLDQGLGPMQLYIHYLGGLGPLLFFLVFYWSPRRARRWRWSAPVMTASAFAFATMAFTIGASYVPGGV